MPAPPSITARTQTDNTQPDRHSTPPPDSVPADEPRFTLSATQVAASVAAAVTAAVVGSRLGVAGTVIGAGLASVISVVGGAIFGHSILYTRKQVKKVLQVRATDGGPVAFLATIKPTTADRTVADREAITYADSVATDWNASRPGPERAEPRRPLPTRRRLGTGLLIGIAAAAAVFASSLGAVTMIEAIKGSPLSGGVSGGLSVLGGNGGTSNQPVESGPTVILTESPEPESTEPTAAEPETVTATVTSEVTATETTSAPATSGPSAESAGPGVPTPSAPSVGSSNPAPASPPATAATPATALSGSIR